MKISKIPGLGRFGVFIDDVDFNTITNEEWMEIGKIHLQSLVTILRNTNLTLNNYDKMIYKWGSARALSKAHLLKKYPQGWDWMWQCVANNDPAMDIDDRRWLTTVDGLGQRTEIGRVQRVSGRKDENGNPMGMFAEGDLLWHSNESGQIHHTPAVSLLAAENVIGSSTGFITTTDYYESVSNAFRSELDEMVIVHRFSPGKINPGLPAEQDFLMHSNMCPDEESEIPLVIQSPGGIRGLHYSINTVSQIKGMSVEESRKIFDMIDKELFVDKYIYDHWYQTNNDLCLFDNSITLHRRQGDIKNRLCYRIQYDYTHLQDGAHQPYFQPAYQTLYKDKITEAVYALGIQDFKLP
jgi:alpha-ketoglutarate-dependent taurine dioxygenase